MEYTTLGDTGTTVSRLCLGCMSFGDGESWMVDADEGREIIERAIDLGINFFDTSNSYSNGESERILGETLTGYDRARHVVATKVRFASDVDHPNATGLSRKTIETELDASLARLDMDTIDLYQIHRWDEETPIEETLRILDDAVRRGKVRYIGASSMWAYQFATVLGVSDLLDLERFVSMQNHYNLAYREEEREMLPLCDRNGVGVIPWSPLARGYLTRPHEHIRGTERSNNDAFIDQFEEAYTGGGGNEINERVEELAHEYDVTMAQIALAWLLHKEWVTAPIVGTTSIEHLEDAVAALDITLSEREMTYLEEPYEPVPVVGHH